jgi:hypothetical protein
LRIVLSIGACIVPFWICRLPTSGASRPRDWWLRWGFCVPSGPSRNESNCFGASPGDRT